MSVTVERVTGCSLPATYEDNSMATLAPGQVKHRVLLLLTDYVYDQVTKRRWITLESIIKRNDVAHNMTRYAFNYAGKRWAQVRFKGVPQNVPALDEMLQPEMDAYIAEGKLIEEQEKPMVQAYLRAILNSDPDFSVAMLRIPTALHHPIREALTAIEDETGLTATLDFEQCQELVGAYGPAADAIRKRMMLNMLVE